MDNNDDLSRERSTAEVSIPPPPPVLSNLCTTTGRMKDPWLRREQIIVSTATLNSWDRMFDEGYGCDLVIQTENNGLIYAHSNILESASEVIRGMIKQSNRKHCWKLISIRGVPRDAVRVFIRFLYSSRYEKEDMKAFAIHLLVLSHVYVVPHLKRLCEQHFEKGLLTKDNMIDVFQLSLLCDAPRLGLLCHRMILRKFELVSISQGWLAMKNSHPRLANALLRAVAYDEYRQKHRIEKQKEQKIYSQLYEAMEAFIHICKEGCRTIGPLRKEIHKGRPQCNYSTCKSLEMLLRHFARCKLRVVPGGCNHCKRMWQLIELHSRLCIDSEQCKVPLCGNFKERMRKQSKKDDTRWKLLVKYVLSTKRIGRSPFFLRQYDIALLSCVKRLIM